MQAFDGITACACGQTKPRAGLAAIVNGNERHEHGACVIGGGVMRYERGQACDCGAPTDGKHGACIGGGGVLPLCDACRARLCACGSFLIPEGAHTWREGTEHGAEYHRHHRCETVELAAGEMFERVTQYEDRPNGCACDLCRII